MGAVGRKEWPTVAMSQIFILALCPLSLALPLVCDIRDENQVKSAIDQTVAKFGGIDILVSSQGCRR